VPRLFTRYSACLQITPARQQLKEFRSAPMTHWSAQICKALQSMQNSSPDSLPPYDEEAVHQTKGLVEMIRGAAERSEIPVRRIILEREAEKLQEGLDLYHRSRLVRIMNIRCECRGQPGPQVRKALAPHEVEFLNSYTQALATYTRSAKLDPAAPFTPPLGLNAEVKVLRDAGSIMAGDSYVSLKQNEILTLRTNVAQELEQLGFVQITEYLK
jgi:hypothetical protein